MVRSVFAELLARHLGLAVPVGSAATRFRSVGMFPETAVALAERGVPVEWLRAFRSRHLDDVRAALPPRTVFLGMTKGHLHSLHDDERGRGFLLGTSDGGVPEIADPVLEGADFGRTFARIEACVKVLVEGYGSATSTRR
jgi:protein-tyrosine-phosphatase